MNRPDDERTIATLRLGQREELRITVTERNGKRTIKLRTWFQAKDGQFRPGKHGMQIRADAVDDLLLGLARAKASGERTAPL